MTAHVFRKLSSASLVDPLDASVCMPRIATLCSWKDRVICRPGPATESRLVIILEGLLDFGSGIHDKRSVLDDGLSDGPPLQDKEFGFALSILD